MYTFGPLIAKNSRSGRLLGGAPVTVTTLNGVTLATAPAGLVTNHEGYLPAFTVDTDQVTVMARPRGGDPLPLHAHEGIQGAAEVAAAIGEAGMGTAGLAVLAASLPAEAREVLGITVDTSVGTRMFVGDTMIHGDTGWRRLPGGTLVRRVGAGVYIHLYGNLPAETGTVEPDTLPPGFRPRWHSGVAYFLGNDLRRCHVLNTGILRFYDVSTSGAFVTMSDHFATDNNWPTTLPGSPA